MGIPQLREYQSEALLAVNGSMSDGVKSIIYAPCGAGKTTIAAALIRDAQKSGLSVLFLAHKRELIKQASDRLTAFGIDHGCILAGHPPDANQPVQVASLMTIIRREYPPADLVIIDECHRARAKSYMVLLKHYRKAALVGLTATPQRLDRQGLGDVYDRIITAANPSELIQDGHLVAPRVFAPKQHTAVETAVEKVKISAGDYDVAQLGALLSQSHLVGDIVGHWYKHARRCITVVFAVNKQHAEMLVGEFQYVGIAAAVLTSDTYPDERDRMLLQLRAGTIQVLVNVNILTEGWDLPALDCVVLARPTMSLAVYLQQCGRALRPHPDDPARRPIILDHADNVRRHGMPHTDRVFQLKTTKESKRPRAVGLAPYRICSDCGAIVPTERKTCPECGGQGIDEIVPLDGCLEEIIDERPRFRPPPCPACAAQTCIEHTYGLFTHAVACSKCDERDYVIDTRNAKKATKADKQSEFSRLELIRERKAYARGWTAHKYRDIFGVWPRGMRNLNRQGALGDLRK